MPTLKRRQVELCGGADDVDDAGVLRRDREDEERLKTYILQRVPPGLKRELDVYLQPHHTV